MPTNNNVSVAIKGRNISKSLDGHLDKRQTITIDADIEEPDGDPITEDDGEAGQAIGEIILAIVQYIEKVEAEWTAQREAFTQQTVQGMMNNNPNGNVYAAAACYDESWGVANYDLISDVVTVTLSTDLGSETYDCMYIEYGNSFYIYGDGGYENVAYDYYDKCSMNSADTLTCSELSSGYEVGASDI